MTITVKKALATGLAASLVAAMGTLGVSAAEGTARAGGSAASHVAPWLWTVGWTSPHPPLPQVRSNGGPSGGTPKIVPVLYAADPNAAALQAFYSKLGTSQYLPSTLKEYGVQGVIIAPPVVLATPPPATMTDGELGAWLTQALGSTLPPDDGNTIYSFVFPTATALSVVQPYYGYTYPVCGQTNWELYTASGRPLPATLTALCTGVTNGLSDIDFLTSTTAQAIANAMTNPYVNDNPGYSDPSWDGSGWMGLSGTGQVADACSTTTPYATPADLGFLVPRIWSNAAAAADTEPCLPSSAPAEPYFNAAPVIDGVQLFSAYFTKGVSVPPGGSTTIPVYLFAKGDVCDWQLSATELPGMEAASTLTFSFDETTGRRGEVRYLTITRSKVTTGRDASMLGFKITSTSGTMSHDWLVAVGK